MLLRYLLIAILTLTATSAFAAEDPPVKRVAAIVTSYYHNSHADVIVSRLLETDTLDGKGRRPRLKLVSLYTDQVPDNDKSRKLAATHGFPIYDTVAETLTCGGNELAVDGVLLICEHGDYPVNQFGSIIYPKRRLFAQILEVFDRSERVVPVFIDKHLADNWQDAKWIYDQARQREIPLMAGSSIPVLWRYPSRDVPRGAPLSKLVALSYHTLDGYGFHGLQMLQCLAERRQGGETGIRRVQCLSEDQVWQAMDQGRVDQQVLDAALASLKREQFRGQDMRKRCKHPVLFQIEYADGLTAQMLTLDGAVYEWGAGWKRADNNQIQAACFYTQEARPFMHFSFLLAGIEQMMHTGQPAWPVERTLVTSGLLDALLRSKAQNGKPQDTPYLNFSYEVDWTWKVPPPPPPDRPIPGQ